MQLSEKILTEMNISRISIFRKRERGICAASLLHFLEKRVILGI